MAGNVPVSNSTEAFRPQVSTGVSLLNIQQSIGASSIGLSTPTTTPASVHQQVTTTGLKVADAISGAGDNSGVAAGSVTSKVTSFTAQPGSRGDADKPVGSASSGSVSSTFQITALSVPQSQVVVTCSSDVSIAPPEVALSSSLPQITVEPRSLLSVGTQSATPLSVSHVAQSTVGALSQPNTSSGGNLRSFTSFTPAGGFAPIFGNVNTTVASASSNLSTVHQQQTETARQQPQTQPATVSVSSNPVSFGSFANQSSFTFSAGDSNQSGVMAAAVIPSASISVSAVAQPSLTQSASGGFSLPFRASATTAFGSSGSQNFGKDQNTSVQFGSLPVQPSLSSSASNTSLSTFAPSVVPFGNSGQQPSFRPVFGNSDGQQAMSGFGSFGNNAAAPSFTSQPTTCATTQAPSLNTLQTTGSQAASGSVGGFAARANPFGSSTFPPGSGIFGISVPKSDGQSTTSSFGSFTSVSAGGLFGNSAIPPGSSVFGSSVTNTDSQTTSSLFSTFPGMPAGGHTFASSAVQTGSTAFGNASAPKSDSQPSLNSFGGFTGISAASFAGAPAPFGNSAIQQGSSVFGSSSGPVFNGKPATTSAAQQSLPNGFHKSTASVGPFAFASKADQTSSGTASPFNFSQSADNVNGFPMSTPVPNFGSSTPASSFTFGKFTAPTFHV